MESLMDLVDAGQAELNAKRAREKREQEEQLAKIEAQWDELERHIKKALPFEAHPYVKIERPDNRFASPFSCGRYHRLEIPNFAPIEIDVPWIGNYAWTKVKFRPPKMFGTDLGNSWYVRTEFGCSRSLPEVLAIARNLFPRYTAMVTEAERKEEQRKRHLNLDDCPF